MNFTLRVDYLRERGYYEKYYRYLNKKKKQKAIMWLVLGVIYFLMGYYMQGRSNSFEHTETLSIVLKVLGALQTTVYAFYLLRTLPNHKKKYLAEIDRQYKVFADNNVTEYTFGLNDEQFILDNSLNTTKVAWSVLDSYQVYEDILLFHMNKGNGLFYLFGKEEFSDQDFDRIIDFVSDKLKKRKN
ncbi:MAG: hypothetical protein H6551_02270 [Chitinophagales bacterium]|nr:hypothetical protein [Chitinophagaceae bacterium]MCB9063949.1 hypothetical protein [Chitinophagales bacterium]